MALGATAVLVDLRPTDAEETCHARRFRIDACRSEQNGAFVPPAGLFDEHTNPDLVKVLFHLVGGTWIATTDQGNTWESLRAMLWPDLGAVLWCSTATPDSSSIDCTGYKLMLHLWSIASTLGYADHFHDLLFTMIGLDSQKNNVEATFACFF